MVRSVARVLANISLLIVTMIFLTGAFNVIPVAAASCSGDGCNYKDAIKAGCSQSGATLEWDYERDVYGNINGEIALEHSYECRANWNINWSFIGRTWLYAQVTRDDGLQTWLENQADVINSPMLGAINHGISGCGSVYDVLKGWDPTKCTGRWWTW